MLRLLALALLLATPAGAALTLRAVPPAAPLAPEVETGLVRLTVDLDCMEVWSHRTPTSQAAILLQVQAPSYVVVTGPSSLELPTEQCPTPQGTASVQAELAASFTRLAPGLTAVPMQVAVQLAGQPLPLSSNPASAQATIPLVAAPFHLIEVRALSKLECTCPEAVFTAIVANFGNTQTQVDFALTDVQTGVSVVLPSAVVLESPNAGVGATNQSITVRATLAGAAQGVFTLTATPRSVLAPDAQGTPVSNSFLAVAPPMEMEGLETEAVPLPTAPLLALLLLGLAVVARRRA